MDIAVVKEYLRVDYDDDDGLIRIILDAILDEMTELIPSFNRESPTSRQKMLILMYAKDLYDNRGRQEEKNSTIRFAVHSLMLKEMLR